MPILCSSGRQYQKIYRRGILKTFAAIQLDSPKVMPYFGVASFFESSFADFLHTILAVTRLYKVNDFRKRIFCRKKTLGTEIVHSDLEIVANPVLSMGISYKFDILEVTDNVALRFLTMLNFVLKNEEVDFIWHSNVSTYLNLNRMQKFLDGVSQDLFYAGTIGNYRDFHFVSGASVCLSRDTAELVILHKQDWDYSLPWDVALGKLLHSLAVYPNPLGLILLLHVNEVARLPDVVLNNTINFRCKAGIWSRKDHEIMKAIHKRLLSVDIDKVN